MNDKQFRDFLVQANELTNDQKLQLIRSFQGWQQNIDYESGKYMFYTNIQSHVDNSYNNFDDPAMFEEINVIEW